MLSMEQHTQTKLVRPSNATKHCMNCFPLTQLSCISLATSPPLDSSRQN